MKHPAQSELDQLQKLAERADKVAADAAQWIARLDRARAHLADAQARFLEQLDAKTAEAVTEANSSVAALAPAVATIEAAGGPAAFRSKVLRSPEAFALFAAGFTKRHAAIEKLKPAARALYTRFTGEAVAAGADPRELIGLNETADMRGASDLLARIDGAAHSALVLSNYAKAPTQTGVTHSFESLLDALAAPLPVVPEL